MPNFKQYITTCPCGRTTSKIFARANGGKCKTCATGVVPETKSNPRYTCPDCQRENALTEYQVRHHYHCDTCTRNTDPIGYYNEVIGYSEPSY
jgi:uncharacterized OB-fold protein